MIYHLQLRKTRVTGKETYKEKMTALSSTPNKAWQTEEQGGETHKNKDTRTQQQLALHRNALPLRTPAFPQLGKQSTPTPQF